MKIIITSDPVKLKIVRKKLLEFINLNKITTLDKDKVILAVDEAIQNIIRHAYTMQYGCKIEINFSYDKNLTVLLRDYGKQVPLEEIKPRNLKEVRPGGLGVHFIKSICKEVIYTHQKKGTLLKLVF